MKMLIIILIAFLALVYVYTFIKVIKKRKNTKSVVEDFNEKYLDKDKKNSDTKDSRNANYKKYITKYNSKIDYITRDEL